MGKKFIDEKIVELKANPTVIKIKDAIEKEISKIEKMLKKAIDELVANPKFIEIKKELETRINEMKTFIEAKANTGMKFIEQKINEIKWLIKMKFIELKQNLVEFQAKHEENIQKLIKLLKQIETSAKFTGEKLRLYATPYLRSYMTKSMGYIGAAPVLVEDAVTYFAEAPEDSFWYGMEVTKEALTGAYA